MRIDTLLAERTEPLFSFEFFPPKTEEGEKNLLEAVAALRELDPAFVSVTYGAGGSTRDKTLEVVDTIKKEYGLEAMAHFTCVAATVDELRATLDKLSDIGVENVLALRGDMPDGGDWTATEGGLSYSSELVELINREYPQFAIGAACFPETHVAATSPEDDLAHLAEKVTAGTDLLVTQLFFDNAVYFDFVDRARAAGITVPIVPGVLPITNIAQLTRITSLCGAALSHDLMAELNARADDPEAVHQFGVAYATLQCAELLAGGAPGIHFYTLNRSPATRAILSALRLHRPWENSKS
ncbi:MAG: methylenetetrahydrofolate reductase [NAD(P)H] [Actinobacteria bacterium]|uniref:methylenetetrahydrofolate reductase (NADH) n=1 Tax=freshwater metagenome TaxID=449393 RepID=A0A6J7D274_9ZZZZ|nr:methylenetetrahydrofolate reductase [NAD(P)H] [Actinomycetota bacterium]